MNSQMNQMYAGKKIVIASSNAGKLREFGDLLADLGVEAMPQSAFNVSDALEPHATFVENALEKARHAARLTGLPALADDSGICAVALGGAPGVYSARYAGEPRDDTRNNEKLVRELAAYSDNRAFYYCVLVLVRHADDPQPIIVDGQWWGEIIDTPRGAGGFGYDPYFYSPAHGKTGAELAPEIKNKISHRGVAMQSLKLKLQQIRAF
jgi:XTP/dITP diphosphohydrolase